MNTFSRILALLLALVTLFCFTACDSPPDQPDAPDDGNTDSTPDSTPEASLPKDAVVLTKDTLSTYQLVRSDLAKNQLTASAMTLRYAINEALGAEITPKTDWEDVPEGIKEIIVGDTKRAASAGIKSALAPNTFRICVVDGNIVICGSDDVMTDYAVTHFINTFVNGKTMVSIPNNTDITVTELEWLASYADGPVTYKKHYSDYVSDYTEEQLLSYDDEGEEGYRILMDGTYEPDLCKEGYGAIKWEATEDYGQLREILTPQGAPFYASVDDFNTTTLKLWLFVNDTDLVTCDHDAGYGVQKNQATFFFRAVDKAGRVHAWNHTITNNGWHEIELSFNIENGVTKNFDYQNITGFRVLMQAHKGAVVMIDDLRLVKYNTDYTPATIEGETNPRLISDGEYNAFDGAIIQEWYGASYDLEDKVQGNSSLHNRGNSTVSDFRTIIANLDLPTDYDKDVLVFHLKIAKVSDIKSFFVELNTVQDNHEYQATFTIEQLKSYGYTAEDGAWSEIRIPLSSFAKNLGMIDTYGEKVQLRNFRFVANASSTLTEYDYHIDHIYLCEK
ncbi:MAG: hypothetical protein IJW97_00845 [Clostridia bacterium]|nr:hypothetical protein [Clostridia bacterium]